MTSDVIKLVTVTRTQNSIGVWEEKTTERQVFCRVTSVSGNEFFDAAKIGIRPEYRFIIFAGDYEGEAELLYHGVAYAIYRTYHGTGDQLELYAETKAGVTNG